jgi:hypothetical protein
MSREGSHRACLLESAASWSNSGQVFQLVPVMPGSVVVQRLDHLLSRENKGLTWGAVLTTGTGGTPCHYEVVKRSPLQSGAGFAFVRTRLVSEVNPVTSAVAADGVLAPLPDALVRNIPVLINSGPGSGSSRPRRTTSTLTPGCATGTTCTSRSSSGR